MGKKISDTLRAAKAAVTRGETRDDVDTARGVELQPITGQTRLARRSVSQNHVCDEYCGDECEKDMRY